MRLVIPTGVVLSALSFSAVNGARIMQSNDDGWAEKNVRVFHDRLALHGHDVVLSCPADNKSGTGSRDKPPKDRLEKCMYDSCPERSGGGGWNLTSPRLNWVNGYPVTAVRYGLKLIGPHFWNRSQAELVVSGPNTGSNLWGSVHISGTVAIATYAARQAGVPAIAFSGASLKTHMWNETTSLETDFYAKIATNITNTLINAGKPYLPWNVFLNVNMPVVRTHSLPGPGSRRICSDPSHVKMYLTRIYPGWLTPPDVEWCGVRRLPTEFDVHLLEDCAVTISVGEAQFKTTANAEEQKVALESLKPLLSCFHAS